MEVLRYKGAKVPQTVPVPRLKLADELRRKTTARITPLASEVNAQLLRHEPLCRMCAAENRVAEAVELDHIIPLHKGGADDESNLQPLCKRCHEKKTADDCGYKERVEIGLDGWPRVGGDF